ncbi:hypothetical protein D3C78_664110 [compost metagenome]
MNLLVLLVIFMPCSRKQADPVHTAVKGTEVLFIRAFDNNAAQPFFPACLCFAQDLSEAVPTNLPIEIQLRLLPTNKGSAAFHFYYTGFRYV